MSKGNKSEGKEEIQKGVAGWRMCVMSRTRIEDSAIEYIERKKDKMPAERRSESWRKL